MMASDRAGGARPLHQTATARGCQPPCRNILSFSPPVVTGHLRLSCGRGCPKSSYVSRIRHPFGGEGASSLPAALTEGHRERNRQTPGTVYQSARGLSPRPEDVGRCLENHKPGTEIRVVNKVLLTFEGADTVKVGVGVLRWVVLHEHLRSQVHFAAAIGIERGLVHQPIRDIHTCAGGCDARSRRPRRLPTHCRRSRRRKSPKAPSLESAAELQPPSQRQATAGSDLGTASPEAARPLTKLDVSTGKR